MQWDASENAGFTTGTPWIGIADNYKAINAAAQMDDPDSIRSFYKTLVALRKKMPVISAGKIEFLYPDNADLYAGRRRDGAVLATCGSGNSLPCDAEKLLGNYPDTADSVVARNSGAQSRYNRLPGLPKRVKQKSSARRYIVCCSSLKKERSVYSCSGCAGEALGSEESGVFGSSVGGRVDEGTTDIGSSSS